MDRDILGSGFYTYHEGKEVTLGLITDYGVWTATYPLADWIDWLRFQLELSKPVVLPEVWKYETINSM